MVQTWGDTNLTFKTQLNVYLHLLTNDFKEEANASNNETQEVLATDLYVVAQ